MGLAGDQKWFQQILHLPTPQTSRSLAKLSKSQFIPGSVRDTGKETARPMETGSEMLLFYCRL